MLDVNVEAYPVFTRWQVQCCKCGSTFYVDTEPETTKEDLINLVDMQCSEHPREDSVIMLV